MTCTARKLSLRMSAMFDFGPLTLGLSLKGIRTGPGLDRKVDVHTAQALRLTWLGFRV